MADTITITSRGESMTAELYTPVGTTTDGAIIIAYGSDGLTAITKGPGSDIYWKL